MSEERAFERSLPPLAVSASTLFAFRLCRMLIDKGVLSRQEAAGLMSGTARDIRLGADDADQDVGEVVALSYDQLASWLLGSGRALV